MTDRFEEEDVGPDPQRDDCLAASVAAVLAGERLPRGAPAVDLA